MSSLYEEDEVNRLHEFMRAETNWKLAYQEALDYLCDIPHPMAEEAVEYLTNEYSEEEEDE